MPKRVIRSLGMHLVPTYRIEIVTHRLRAPILEELSYMHGDINTLISHKKQPQISRNYYSKNIGLIMAILPHELLLEICFHADFRTLQQLRLVDRTMNEFAAKFLFDEIEFTMLPNSYQNAYNIIQSRVLCCNVKFFVYYCLRLDPDFTDFEAWKACALPIPDKEVPTRSDHEYWRKFCEMVSAQRALVAAQKDHEILCLALKKLPNLESIELVDTYWADDHRDGGIYRRVAREVRLSPGRAFLDASNAPFSPGSSPDVVVLEALNSHKNYQIQRLHLYDVPWATCDDPDSFSFYKCVQITAKASFASLRSLKLQLWVHLDRIGRIEYNGSKISLLCNLLRFAPLLEELSLSAHQILVGASDDRFTTDGHISKEQIRIQVTDIFWLLRWQNLRYLELYNCDVNTQAFVTFCERHSPTLENVNLFNLKLSDCPHNELNPPVPMRPNVNEFSSAWEWAVFRLGQVMDLRYCTLDRITDDELAVRIKRGDWNGISVEWLVRSWRMEIALYLKSWHRLAPNKPYWPSYGMPCVIADADTHEDNGEDDD